MGDKFENISNSTIVNRSKLNNSFNSIKEQFDEETANALIEVSKLVEASKNANAAEIFDSFNEEVAKPVPKKSILKSLWDGLTTVLPVLSTATNITEKIIKIFAG